MAECFYRMFIICVSHHWRTIWLQWNLISIYYGWNHIYSLYITHDMYKDIIICFKKKLHIHEYKKCKKVKLSKNPIQRILPYKVPLYGIVKISRPKLSYVLTSFNALLISFSWEIYPYISWYIYCIYLNYFYNVKILLLAIINSQL